MGLYPACCRGAMASRHTERLRSERGVKGRYVQFLYRVHEVALGAVEDDDGEEEGDEHEDGAIE